MPILKPDQPQLPEEVVHDIRKRLSDPYRFEVINRDEKRLLFVRVGAEEPNPVDDLEAALDSLPTWVPADFDDVILLGATSDLHVPGRIAVNVLTRRRSRDQTRVQEMRSNLDVRYGLRLAHDPGDLLGANRLFLRLPHAYCNQATERDLVECATRIGPLHDAGTLDGVIACYLVADEDHVRLATSDFLADLVPRWQLVQQERKDREAAQPQPEQVVPTARARRIEDVTPLFELEADVDADPEPLVLPGETHVPPLGQVSHMLGNHGYRIREAPFLTDTTFVIEAERRHPFPRTVGVLSCNMLDRSFTHRAERIARDRNLDLVLVLARDVDPVAVKRLATSRVKVIRPNEVHAFQP